MPRRDAPARPVPELPASVARIVERAVEIHAKKLPPAFL